MSKPFVPKIIKKEKKIHCDVSFEDSSESERDMKLTVFVFFFFNLSTTAEESLNWHDGIASREV
jgi:hypothetical protein